MDAFPEKEQAGSHRADPMYRPALRKEKIHMAEEMLYTVEEVAEILKTNVNYVYSLRKAGLLRFLKIGRLKCRRSTLEAFLAEYEGKDLTDPYDVKELAEEKEVQAGVSA